MLDKGSMSKLTRLLMLLAVALLAARPVMACCLDGHPVSHMAPTDVETSPCHDVQDTIPAGLSGEAPVDCPSQLDCETALRHAQTFDDGTLLASVLKDVPLPAVLARFDGFEAPRLVLKTGPPGDPPPLTTTPVRLKQRLLN